jgi:hypothetical protein
MQNSREFVTVNQAKSSFCPESLSRERKGGPGALHLIPDTCFYSSLTDRNNGIAHAPLPCHHTTSTYNPCSHLPTTLMAYPRNPQFLVGGVTLASKWNHRAKEVVPCPGPWTKARNQMHWQLGGSRAKSQEWGAKGRQIFLWWISPNGQHALWPASVPTAALKKNGGNQQKKGLVHSQHCSNKNKAMWAQVMKKLCVHQQSN